MESERRIFSSSWFGDQRNSVIIIVIFDLFVIQQLRPGLIRGHFELVGHLPKLFVQERVEPWQLDIKRPVLERKISVKTHALTHVN